eukprot:m.972843 g.972843  ORF g.972843 m.972843 type:complete len:943 (+) comp23931_c0_seq10:376-3204(+)
MRTSLVAVFGFLSTAWAQSFHNCSSARVVSPVDGEYIISVANAGGTHEYEVFCYMMGPNVEDADAPYTYIDVPTLEAGSNQAQWVFGNVTVTTRFRRVRFDPVALRLITGDLTFATTTTSAPLDMTEYCEEQGCGSGLKVPYRSGGCTTAYPDAVGVPYGLGGLCNAIEGTSTSCPFPNPPAPVYANINLTGTGLRLVTNTGMRFLYPDDDTRQDSFTTSGTFSNSFNTNITADTTFSNSNTIMSVSIPYTLGSFDNALGYCRWVTTEQWLGELSGQPDSILIRAQALRRGSATLCVCKDTEGGNADCDISNCTYDGASFQLHYFNTSTATACNTTEQYQAADFTPTSDRVCPQLRVCDMESQFISTAPTATSDRQCTNLTVCDYGTQFDNVTATATTDRTCDALTVCPELISVNKTVSSDRECTNFTTCTDGQYASVVPSAYVDRVCTNLTVCTTGTTQYILLNETATSDRVCDNITSCTPGEYVMAEFSDYSDRLCDNCTAPVMYTDIGSFSNTTNAAACTPTDNCTFTTQYERVPPTATSNRVCADADVCTFATQYETAPLTITTDRQCTNLTECAPAYEYVAVVATPTTNRACNVLDNCTMGQYVSAPNTTTTDRVCSDCNGVSNFSDTVNAAACAAVQPCAGGAVEFQAPSATADRVCTPCVPASEYVSGGGCVGLRECTSGEVEVSAPTLTTDRVCEDTTTTPAAVTSTAAGGNGSGDASSGDGGGGGGGAAIIGAVVVVVLIALLIFALWWRKKNDKSTAGKPLSPKTPAGMVNAYSADTKLTMQENPLYSGVEPGGKQPPGNTEYKLEAPGGYRSTAFPTTAEAGPIVYDTHAGATGGSQALLPPTQELTYSVVNKSTAGAEEVLYSDMDLQQQAARAPADGDRVTYTTVNQPPNPDQLNYADMDLVQATLAKHNAVPQTDEHVTYTTLASNEC